MLGSNDSVGAVEPPDNIPTTVEEYGHNIERMAFKTIKLGTPLVVLMTPATRIDCIEQAIQGQQAGIDCLDRLKGYTNEVKRICDISGTDGVVCGPDVQAMSSADPWVFFEFGSTDKTHFTDAGHLAIASALVEILHDHGVGRPKDRAN
jgi:lysophospholipase L1-like esterase